MPRTIFRTAMIAVSMIMISVTALITAAPAQAAPTPGSSPTVHIWATQVNARHGGSSCISYPSVGNCSTVGAQLGPGNQKALCQKAGATNTDAGYSSNYWTWVALSSGSGFVSNVYITGAAHLAGVPDCQTGDPASVRVWATSVNVRSGGSACVNNPSVGNCPSVVTTVNPATVTALCQQSGATNTDAGYTSSYWSWLVLPGGSGYVSNVYLTGAAHIAGEPDCYKAPTVHVPGAPTGVTATAGNAQATVKWTAPSSNGGATITKYTVTASPGGRTATATGTSATVTSLVNGTSYTFTVTATNSAGTGPASAKSNAVTPKGPVTAPGAPTGVTATAGDAQASVKWTAPSSNGGATITKYTVTASPGGRTATATSTSATVTGLTNGTSYTFTVTATNSAGTGPASAKSNAVTPTAAPSISCYDSTQHCWGVDRLDPLSQSDLDGLKAGIGDGHYPDFVGRYITRGAAGGLLTSSEVAIYHADHIALELLADETGGCSDAGTGIQEASDAAAAAAALGLAAHTPVSILLDEDEGVAVTADCEKAYADTLVAKGYTPGFYLNPGSGHASGEGYCAAIDDANVANAVVWSDEAEIERPAYDRNNSPAFDPEQPTCGNGAQQTYGWQYMQPGVAGQYGQGDPTDGYDVDEVAPDRTSTLWLP